MPQRLVGLGNPVVKHTALLHKDVVAARCFLREQNEISHLPLQADVGH